MKFPRIASLVLLLPLLCVMFSGSARGDEWNKKTIVTFNQIVEIPGRLLPAGTYVLKLVESVGYRHIVQVWDQHETTVLATILAVPNYRLESTGESVVIFYEGGGLGPQALRAWFYPGDNFGQEFVYYPATLAHLLAKLANAVVPAERVEPNKQNLKSAPLVAVTPDGKEEEITEAIQTTAEPGPRASGNPRTSRTPPSSSRDREADEPATTFHAFSELVVLSVNVTDSRGNFVSGLLSRDFRVYEDGQPQKITFFEREDVPVTVGLIVDHSRSMQPKLPSVSAAISGFAHSSNPDDEMFVVDFSDRVWPELFGGKLFTSNVKELEGALMSVAAQGETALYDAVYEGLQRMRLAHRDKKALIIVSDGGDNSSRRKYSEVLALARQSQAIIYVVGLVGASGEEENPRVLERLSKDTGGLAFFPKTFDTVTDISNRIALDLRQQYTIGYVPPKKAGDGAFRKVKVKASSPGRGKLHVRTRADYSMVRDRTSESASRVQQ